MTTTTTNYIITKSEIEELAREAYEEILEISPHNYYGAEHAYNREYKYWEQFEDEVDWEH